MYHAKSVVGNFFEDKVMQLFDLARLDQSAAGNVPDLVSGDCSFFVEVKASAYDNGGVINKTQLYKFDKEITIRRFYAFPFHSIRNMIRNYPTEDDLRKALDLRSLFLFPFSIPKAHFENSKKRKNPKHDDFVQMRERQAFDIFNGDPTIWDHLKLPEEKYKKSRPHEKVYILTRDGHLEKDILDSFHPELV